jgi:hypothetical protein
MAAAGECDGVERDGNADDTGDDADDDQALCPPTDPAKYMEWLRENKAALKEFFGPLNARSPDDEPTV